MSSVTPVPRRDSAVVAWVKKHPLPAYFIWAFGVTWLFAFPIAFSQQGLGLFSLPDGVVFALFLLATYVGPAPAAFIVTGIIDGKAGVKQLLRRMVQWRVGIRWYLIVILGYPLLFLAGLTLVTGTDTLKDAIQNWPLIFTVYVPLILFGMLYPALGEEPGWRGFALPRLQVMYGPIVASLVLGSLHALWHLPVYFIPGAITNGGFDLNIFIANSLTIIVATIVWTWLFNNAGASILFAMLVHATSNAAVSYIGKIEAITVAGSTGIPSGAAAYFSFVLFGVVALLVIIFTRGRLSYHPEVATQTSQADAEQSISRSLASQAAK
jgi:membrane protease YdiL (CAAX protease family)